MHEVASRVEIDESVKPGYMRHYIPLPDDVAEAIRSTGADRVVGTVEGRPFSRALFQANGDVTVLRFGESWLRDSNLVVGDAVKLVVRADPTGEGLELPAELESALDAHPVARAAWESATPGRRRTLAHMVARGKRVPTREKYAAKVITELSGPQPLS